MKNVILYFSSSFSSPYLFNGKELDRETNLSYYGARYLDMKTSLWLTVDPKMEKYPNVGGYVYALNNPMKYIDPDGRDIVYFDVNGNELVSKRVVSNKVYETRIARNNDQTSFSKVPMPNVIQKRSQTGEDVSGSAYQQNDYIIAARTGLFNQSKNEGLLQLYTESGNAIPKDQVSKIPDLDPTLVKAIAIQESHNGTTGVADIMTANNGGDYDKYKTAYGLTKGESVDTNRSLYLGIRFLATKGFRGGVTYDKTTGKKTYNFKGWEDASGNYNGGGVAGYQGYVKTMVDESKKTTTDQ